MAKSLRSKREKRLRTLRREIAQPFYDKKEAAKLAAQAAALEAPALPVRAPPPPSKDSGGSRAASSSASAMGGGQNRSAPYLLCLGCLFEYQSFRR
ncbi:hypothetical protein DAI22_04g257400 [Oryza sativa Japonica Group]|nr:hypothetical protein DAI22_04g257400 [Oryza sativa Japonica Group]